MSTLSTSLQPFTVLEQWLDEATQSGLWRNPNALALATTDVNNQPSVRMLLMKAVSAAEGYIVFYTHYSSRKGLDLARNDRAAGALYWERFGRQVRLEGRVVPSPATESDAYFASRGVPSQLNAWASHQSQPLDDLTALEERAEHKARELGVNLADEKLTREPPRLWDIASTGSEAHAEVNVPRPAAWGGYRLWCTAVELWVEGHGRFHERVRFERELMRTTGGFHGGAWSGQRLQP